MTRLSWVGLVILGPAAGVQLANRGASPLFWLALIVLAVLIVQILATSRHQL